MLHECFMIKNNELKLKKYIIERIDEDEEEVLKFLKINYSLLLSHKNQ